MPDTLSAKYILWVVALAGASLAHAPRAWSQSPEQPISQKMDLEKVAALLQQLQAQIQELHSQVDDLKAQQQSARTESAELRKQLQTAETQLMALESPLNHNSPNSQLPESSSQELTTEERINRLEENQQLADGKIAEQSQTKIESGSKYRVRLSGIALFGMFVNRGNVDNVDFPQLALQPDLLSNGGSFGGTLRQSQIGVQAFGPTIAGARTSADVQFDFAGGFPDTPNGASFGIMRLRTGTVRFDWPQTSIVAGQDTLFFAPLAPTSLATLALPPLAYAGNLWSWAPQIRVEHKFSLSDSSSLLLQGGILDPLTGDNPPSSFYRYPSWGEASGMPAYAVRVAWTHEVRGQTFTLGAGGYYARQEWGFGRGVDSWAGTIDAKMPLGTKFEFSSQFYRGRALGGLGGGIGQSVLWNGSLFDPATPVQGLDSIGGWAQLKFKPTAKLQFNGAWGSDNPFAWQLREYGGNINFYPEPLSKNQSGFMNFIYQPRSDVVFSLEFRRIKTFTLDGGANAANITNLSLGYIF